MIPDNLKSYYADLYFTLRWDWIEEDESGMAVYKNWKVIWVRDIHSGHLVIYTAHNGVNEIGGYYVEEILYRIDYGLL